MKGGKGTGRSFKLLCTWYILYISDSIGRISINDSLHVLRLMQLMIENAAQYRSQYGAAHQEP